MKLFLRTHYTHILKKFYQVFCYLFTVRSEINAENNSFSSQADDIAKRLNKPNTYSSSLEPDSSEIDFFSQISRSKNESSVPIREAIDVTIPTTKTFPAEKTFIQPKTPIVPSNPFKEDYDETKNPFAVDEDKNNPFSDDFDDHYDSNSNRFSS